MTGYERECRWLLAAFPSGFRQEQGEAVITTLLDDAPPNARWVSMPTVFDLVASGARIRAARAGATTLRRGVSEGFALAAVIGLGLQAAVAIASAVYRAEHGVVFYLPVGPVVSRYSALGAQSLATWIVLAVAGSAAFAAAVRGAWRIAAIVSVAASAYLVSTAAQLVVVARMPGDIGSPAVWGGGLSRYGALSATPGFLAIGTVAAALAVITAVRSCRRVVRPRSSWWLATAAGLALMFSLVGDGDAVQGSASHLMTAYPPQGGIMTALQVVFAFAMVVAVVWSRLDPRVGWAIAILAIPFIVHQVSDLTIGSFYYGYLYQPWWDTALPLILGVTGVVALTTSATLTSRRLTCL